MKKQILIFSAGGSGREIFQLIFSINKLKNEWDVIGYVDDDPKKIGKKIDDVIVYSNKNKPNKKNIYAACGIMDHINRKNIFENEIIKNGYQTTNLIHPSVEIPKCFKIGKGNIIFGNVHVSFEVNIKNFNFICNFCDLGHNLISHDFVTILPSVVVGGNCEIGAQTIVGSGAKLHQGIKIGENCKIGMGSIITDNVKKNTSVIDHPRKVISENK